MNVAPESDNADSVVLLLSHGPGGALGLVVNRPSDVELSVLASRIAEFEDSTSWRLTAPVRFLGRHWRLGKARLRVVRATARHVPRQDARRAARCRVDRMPRA